MSGRTFFDTNILVYAADGKDDSRAPVARDLLREAASDGTGVLSYQVVQEFFNVALGKFRPPMSSEDAILYTRTVLRDFEILPWSMALCERAFATKSAYRLSWYDSLIVAAALEAGCKWLYTEDLQHEQRIDGLTIINPFAVRTFPS